MNFISLSKSKSCPQLCAKVNDMTHKNPQKSQKLNNTLQNIANVFINYIISQPCKRSYFHLHSPTDWQAIVLFYTPCPEKKESTVFYL